jgi:hypothetical protein
LLQHWTQLVVRLELALTFDAKIVGASDAVVAISGGAAALAAIVAADLPGVAAILAGAVVAATAAFTAAVGVLFALDVFLAAGLRIARVALVADAGGAVAASFNAGVNSANDVVAAVVGGTTGAAARAAIGGGAAFFAISAARSLTALAGRAHAHGASIAIGVTLLIRTTFGSAAAVGATARGVVAKGVYAQGILASVAGAGAFVVALLGTTRGARFLLDAIVL